MLLKLFSSCLDEPKQGLTCSIYYLVTTGNYQVLACSFVGKYS